MLRVLLSFMLLSTFSMVGGQELENAYSLGVKGVQLVDAGQHAEGIKLLKKARNLEPHEYDYAFEIGRAYMLRKDPKNAEKHLFPLQYHMAVSSDLYLLLADCYAQLESQKKSPDPARKKELDALRYGIQKLPSEGVLYLELGKRNLELERPEEALVALETGIRNAPNFAENYFWAAKLMKASGNHLWAWMYAEICFNMSDDVDVLRSSAQLIHHCSGTVLSPNWGSAPEKMDADLNYTLKEHCSSASGDDPMLQAAKRQCLLQHWGYGQFAVSPIFERMLALEKRGWLTCYTASIIQDIDKAQFLKWLADNRAQYEAYRNWRYWNPMALKVPMHRLD